MESDQTKIEQLKSRLHVMFRRVVDRTKLASVMLAHYEWIIGLEKSSKVLASSPLFDPDDGPGVGMTVFRASGFEESIALAQSDPFADCRVEPAERASILKPYCLGHGTLECFDLNASRRFYEEFLGLECVRHAIPHRLCGGRRSDPSLPF